MKEGLKSYSSYQVAALRMILAGISLLLFIKKEWLVKSRKDVKYFAISGIVGSGIPAFLFTAAQTKIPSSLAGALNGLTPLFALLVGVLFLGVQFNRYKMLGVVLGLIGAFLLIFHKGVEIHVYHTGLIVLATLCYGINVNIIKHKLGNYPPIFVAAYPLLIVGSLSLIVLFFTGFNFNFSEPQTVRSFGAILILSIVGTSISLVLFNKLIQKTTAVFASSVTYLIPIVALFWGLIDHEQVTVNQLMGLVLILIAIWLIRKEKVSLTT